MEGYLLRCGSSEHGALRSSHLCEHCVDINAFFLGAELQTVGELVPSDATFGLGLHFGENEIDIGSGELLVQDLGVLGEFCPGLSLHSFLVSSAVAEEHLIDDCAHVGLA